MKILHITQVYLPYEGGSAKRISRILQEGTSFPDYLQHVLTTRKGVSPDLPSQESISGVEVFRTDSLWKFPMLVARLHRKHRYDVIHIHNPRPFWFSWPFLRGTRTVLELHSLQTLSPHKQWLTIFAEKVVDRLVVISRSSREYVAMRHGVPEGKISVLANGLDYALFDKRLDNGEASTATAPTRKAEAPFTIGYLGSIYDWQGVFTIVDAMPEILRYKPSTRLLMVGDGRDKEALINRIAEHGIQDQVELHGYVSSSEVPSCLARMDLFTMLRPTTRATSLTMPMKIFEVGLAGVPLLVSNLPGLLEAGFEDPQSCFFIQNDLSPAAVAETISALQTPKGRAERQQKAVRYQKTLYGRDISWNSVAETQREIYRQILLEAKTGT